MNGELVSVGRWVEGIRHCGGTGLGMFGIHIEDSPFGISNLLRLTHSNRLVAEEI